MNRTLNFTPATIAPNGRKNSGIYSYTFAELPIEILESASVQRIVKDKDVEAIAQSFSPNMSNPLKVSYRDSRYFVIDGAHTLAAIKNRFGEHGHRIPCLVYHNLTPEEEAHMFAKQYENCNQVPLRYRMNANFVANDPEHVAFKALTEKAGLKLSMKGSAGKDTIGAIGKALAIYQRSGSDVFLTALKLIKKTWGGAAWSLQAPILGGVAAFIKQYPNFNEGRFVRSLSIADANMIRRGCSGISKSRDIAYAFSIAKLYNAHGGRNVVNTDMLLA